MRLQGTLAGGLLVTLPHIPKVGAVLGVLDSDVNIYVLQSVTDFGHCRVSLSDDVGVRLGILLGKFSPSFKQILVTVDASG